MEIKITPQTLALANNPAVRGLLKKIATKNNLLQATYGSGSAFLTATIKAETEHAFAARMSEGYLGEITRWVGKPEPRLVSYPATLLSLWLIHLLTPKVYKRTVYFGGILGIVLQELLLKYRVKDSVQVNTEDAPLGTTANTEYWEWREQAIKSGAWKFFDSDTRQFAAWLNNVKNSNLDLTKEDVISSYRFSDILSGKYAGQVAAVLKSNAQEVIEWAKFWNEHRDQIEKQRTQELTTRQEQETPFNIIP